MAIASVVVVLLGLVAAGGSLLSGDGFSSPKVRVVEGGEAGDRLRLPIGGGEEIVVRYVPGGRFTMGSPATEDGHRSNERQVAVTLSSHYWMAETEVTQGQWQAVMGSNPSHFKGDPKLPVENVSWEEAQGFIGRLNEVVDLPQGWEWSLPTEAQWERAARGGISGPYGGTGRLEDMGWFSGNSGGRSHAVKGMAANAYGLYDMHGNVCEWCMDLWDGTTALPGGMDPMGWKGDLHVFRGGSWRHPDAYCRAAKRLGFIPGMRNIFMGFRPALVPSGQAGR